METIEFLSAVLIVSENPSRLESHGDRLPHYGCTLGDLHLAIHPVETFPDHRHGVGPVKLAFTVFDIKALVERLAKQGGKGLYPPHNTGFFWSTAINDPDGNFIEFTKLCDDWFKMLEQRRSQGLDVVTRWKAAKGGA